jgi:hypothetical protein
MAHHLVATTALGLVKAVIGKVLQVFGLADHPR